MKLHDHAIKLSPRGMKVIRFPLTRLVIGLCFVIIGNTAAFYLSELIKTILGSEPFPYFDNFLLLILLVSFSVIGYWIFVSLFEGRKVEELSRSKFHQTGTGILLGFGFIGLVMLIMTMFKGYEVSGWNKAEVLIPVFIMALRAGIVEEILLRGIGFRIIEDGLGTWWSVILTALIFGFLHIWNDNATVISSLSIAITAGVVLALLYVITRKLWIVIGMHFGWNFILGGFFGVPVSGGQVDGLMKGKLVGPEWLTGGEFGPEASIITVAVFVLFAIWLVWYISKHDLAIKPRWKKK